MRRVLSAVAFNAEMLEKDKKNDQIQNSCTKDNATQVQMHYCFLKVGHLLNTTNWNPAQCETELAIVVNRQSSRMEVESWPVIS